MVAVKVAQLKHDVPISDGDTSNKVIPRGL